MHPNEDDLARSIYRFKRYKQEKIRLRLEVPVCPLLTLRGLVFAFARIDANAMNKPSHEKTLNNFSVNPGQSSMDAVVIVDQLLVVDSKQMKYRGV